MDLPADRAERMKLLDELADAEPEAMRRWIERHPRNLMLYTGWDVEDFHASALRDFLDYPRSFWLAPRGSGKSTVALLFCCWLSIARPENWDKSIPDLFPGAPRPIGPQNIRIALTSNSAEKAAELLWQAKATLTDRRVEKLFGPMEGKRWRENSCSTALRTENVREATFTALGLGSKVTGGHYDVVLADDWVTLDNARTELQRNRIRDFWNFTVKGTHEPWARTIGAGTRYHPQDWYRDVKAWADEGEWHLRLTPAVTEYRGVRRSYWPHMFTLEKLDEIKREIGAVAFETQYQNQVDLLLGEFFERKWLENFKRWDSLPAAHRKAAVTVIALDPAIKAGVRNDYSVFLVLSYVAPHFYVRHVFRGQWTQDELIKRARLLTAKFRPKAFGVEVVGGMEFLVQALKRTEGMSQVVRAMRPQQFRGRDKQGRASEVRKFFEQERVFLEEPAVEPGVQRLIEEMMAFPTAENLPGWDDCVDALVWALLLMARRRSRVGRYRRSY